MEIKTIGILGSGVVGQSLAQGFLKSGYEVMIGTRKPEKLKVFINKTGNKIRVGSFQETAIFGNLLVLSVKGDAINDVINMAGKENFKGKILIDPTNPLLFKDNAVSISTKFPDSLAMQIQKALPETEVVKAFNTVASNYMINPKLKEGVPTMFIAGNSKEAKQAVKNIIAPWGWTDIVDTGDITNAHLLESLAFLSILYGFSNNSWTHAFRLLRE